MTLVSFTLNGLVFKANYCCCCCCCRHCRRSCCYCYCYWHFLLLQLMSCTIQLHFYRIYLLRKACVHSRLRIHSGKKVRVVIPVTHFNISLHYNLFFFFFFCFNLILLFNFNFFLFYLTYSQFNFTHYI